MSLTGERQGLFYNSIFPRGRQQAVTAAATLSSQFDIHEADSTAGAMTLTMPNAEDMAGRTVMVRLAVDGGDTTLAFATAIPADQVMTAVGDYVVAYSNGKYWVILDSLLT